MYRIYLIKRLQTSITQHELVQYDTSQRNQTHFETYSWKKNTNPTLTTNNNLETNQACHHKTHYQYSDLIEYISIPYGTFILCFFTAKLLLPSCGIRSLHKKLNFHKKRFCFVTSTNKTSVWLKFKLLLQHKKEKPQNQWTAIASMSFRPM